MTIDTHAQTFSAPKMRELMDAQGRRNKWLAARTGYTVESVARCMTGSMPISQEFAEKSAQALGVPVHWLAEDREVANV